MAARTWINALGGAWSNLYIPTEADFEALDAAFVSKVNGDGGGIYNPASNIVVQGAGMWFAGPSQLTAGALLATANGAPITYGDSDYAQLAAGHSGSTRLIRTTLLRQVSQSGWTTASGVLKSLAVGARCVVPLRVHNGATFVQSAINFKVGHSHASVPALLPKLRVCQLDAFGNITPMCSSGVDANGFLSFALASGSTGSTWYAGGATQQIIYVNDSGYIADRSQYSYFAEIVDESGAGSLIGNVYTDISVRMSSIADNRPS